MLLANFTIKIGAGIEMRDISAPPPNNPCISDHGKWMENESEPDNAEARSWLPRAGLFVSLE